MAALDNMTQPGGGTFTSVGLEHVRTSVFTADGGMRVEPNVAKVLITLTDGLPNPGFEPNEEARLLREIGVNTIAIAIGTYNLTQLEVMYSGFPSVSVVAVLYIL